MAPEGLRGGPHAVSYGRRAGEVRRDGAGANIGVFNLSTQEQKGVLPAPAHSTGLVVSIDGTRVYVFVGTSTVGNIQVFPVDR